MTKLFQYHPELLENYPDITGGVILANDISNGPAPAGLLRAYQQEQAAVLQRIGDMPLSEIESLGAWRRAFRAFGVKPTQYRSAAEALLRRLTKKGDIPSINTLVDLANMVSIRYALPVAAFDNRSIQGPVTVHYADGSEWFLPLGQSEPEHPVPGEVIFSDETRKVIARRWCWRQSDDSAAREDTTSALFTVEAQHPSGREPVEKATGDLLELLEVYAGGSVRSAVLDRDHPYFMVS